MRMLLLAVSGIFMVMLASATYLSAYTTQGMSVDIGPDGYCTVVQRYLFGFDEVPATVTVSLIGRPDYIYAVLNGSAGPVVEASDSTAEISVPGPGLVEIQYGTSQPTSKQEETWTFSANLPMSSKIILPENAVLLGVVKGELEDVGQRGDGRIYLVFPAGSVQIEYILLPPETGGGAGGGSSAQNQTGGTGGAGGGQTGSGEGPEAGTSIWPYLGAAAVAAAAIIGFALWRRRLSGSEELIEQLEPGELDDRDRAIIEALKRLGRATAQDIGRETGIPKSPLYRRLKRLEEMGVVKSYRSGGKTYYEVNK